MKIIFLDFWGVMDGPITRENREGGTAFDPRCGARIEQLCQETGAKIVIISDAVQWFLDEDVTWETPAPSKAVLYARAVADLKACGVNPSNVVGCTEQGPDSANLFDRPAQIRTWLEENPSVESYVIFDDMKLLFEEDDIEELRNKILSTWKTQADGSTPEDWANRVPGPDPESQSRFIRVNSQNGLTDDDAERAKTILEKKRPTELARNVLDAFRESAASAVETSLRRGHTVVGTVDGKWKTKNEP